MAKQQQREISAPQERHEQEAMFVRGPDASPNQENRHSKHQRFSHGPAKAEALAAEARIDLTNQQSADHSPLHQQTSPQHNVLPMLPELQPLSAAGMVPAVPHGK